MHIPSDNIFSVPETDFYKLQDVILWSRSPDVTPQRSDVRVICSLIPETEKPIFCTSGSGHVAFASDSQFSIKNVQYEVYNNGGWTVGGTIDLDSFSNYLYDGKTVYLGTDPTANSRTLKYTSPIATAALGNSNNLYRYYPWLMVYGGYGGIPIAYGMSGCTGDPDNPTTIPYGGSITATFTPNEGKAFSDDSVTVSSVDPVDYTWVPSTGTLTITSATSAVSVLVRGYDGYPVAYAMSGCTSDPENPSFIPSDASSTTMNFTPNDGKAFDMESVRVAGDGYQGEEILFDWYPARGLLIVGRVSSAVSISVIARTVDPYAEAGYTEPEDGNGSFDFDGDGVSMSTLPTVSFTSTGFVRIYNPSLQQLSSLASYMWTDQSFIQTLINHAKQLLENPIESIISLNLLPCSIPNGAAEEVKVLFIPTGVYMPPVSAQFVEVDCGSVQLTETYGSALDYSPYTKVHCFLPYIGTVTLDTDEVMGKTISIKYRIDIATGVCVAHIMLDGDVYYQFSGHCAVAMPITSADFSSYIAAAIGTAKAVAGIAAAGSGAPGVAAALTGTAAPRSTSSKSSETERNPNTGRQVTTGTVSRSSESRGATFGEIAAKGVSNTVGAVMGSKMVVEHSGGFTGNSGYMGVRRPYIVVEIPAIANPRDYSKYNGYPSMITARLGDCTGYTEVQSVQLTGFTATNTELSQIGELLKAGVIL